MGGIYNLTKTETSHEVREVSVQRVRASEEFSVLMVSRKGGKIKFMLNSREERGSIFGNQQQSKQLHRLKRVGESG